MLESFSSRPFSKALIELVLDGRVDRETAGLRVPYELEGAWIRDGQAFTFARFKVESIEFDRAQAY